MKYQSLNQKDDYNQQLFKVVLVGDSYAGKTSLKIRFCEKRFPTNFSTIGFEFHFKQVEIEGQIVKLQIWDLAGGKICPPYPNYFYRQCNGIIFNYDVTNRKSFERILAWNEDQQKQVQDNVIKYLVGNKIDLDDKRQVTYKEGKAMADQLGMQYFETSAKTNTNVEHTFLTLIKEMMAKTCNQVQQITQPNENKILCNC